ncbi:MAG TPA: dihydrodipicolinate synthase family protein [Pyrinomonadaceae bacterium]|jgi:dihydrodipicolinate synthase/N-acetylneuraminate lyase
MQPLTASEINGTWATLLLPINADQSIDFERLSAEIDLLIESGVDGVYSNGTAGEFYAQTADEFEKINLMLAEKCRAANMPFQIGAAHTDAQTALTRAEIGARLQPSAIQVILPDWTALSFGEAENFLQTVAEVIAPVGLVLYNPPHAKRVLSPAELLKMTESVPSLVGVKLLDGDAVWYREMKEVAPRLSVFVPGHRLATGVENGVASGSYSNVACLSPAAAKRWNDLMKKDLKKALEIESRLQRFMNEYIVPFRDRHFFSNQALDKLLAAIGGWARIGTRLRFPYHSIDENEAAPLRRIAQELIPEFFV